MAAVDGLLNGSAADLVRIPAPRSELCTARVLGQDRLARAVEPQQLSRSLEDELATLLPVLRRLPRRIDRIANGLEQGQLSLRVRLLADDRDRRVVTDLVHQVLLTVIGAAPG